MDLYSTYARTSHRRPQSVWPCVYHHSLLREWISDRQFFAFHMKRWCVNTEQLWRTFDEFTIKTLRDRSERMRSKFVRGMRVAAPPRFRLIDCRSSVEEKRVVLVDWHLLKPAYTAVSHTFGQEVYEVFDCKCATKCVAAMPRSTGKPCPGHGRQHHKIVKDVLRMCCILLRDSGSEYVWHDGVCISQHNDAEVEETIKHMGWIYGHAKETVIFLHYIGNPMAPIRHDGELISRWGYRVWTLQEAALSNRRKYCVRVGGGLEDCRNVREFEEELKRWYEDDSTIAVVEEVEYLGLLKRLSMSLMRAGNPEHVKSLPEMVKCTEWTRCLMYLTSICLDTCLQFPTIEMALSLCSVRDSKHEGDRINSILGLAGVTNFVAPKDGNFKASTIDFFKRQGQRGLGRAVFSVNLEWEEGTEDTWVPNLSKQLQPIQTDSYLSMLKLTTFIGSADVMHYEVLKNGMMELRGDGLAYVRIRFRFLHRMLWGDAERAGCEKEKRAVKDGKDDALRMDIGCGSISDFDAFEEEEEEEEREGCGRRRKKVGNACFPTWDHRPILNGRPLEEEESFYVRLVYSRPSLLRSKLNEFRGSAYGLERGRRRRQSLLLHQHHHHPSLLIPTQMNSLDNSLLPFEVHSRMHSVPALLLSDCDDDVDTPASKLGHFYIFPTLRNTLMNTSYTLPTKLVLK